MLPETTRTLLLKLLGWVVAVVVFVAFAAPSACESWAWMACGGLKVDPKIIVGWIALVFNIVLVVFNSWLWQTKIGRWLGWGIPDIRGTWKGQLELLNHLPGIHNPGQPVDFILVVKQTAFQIRLTVYTKESESQSLAAEFVLTNDQFELIYSYRNTPDPHFRHRSSIHLGTAILKMTTIRPSSIKGEYYTDRLTCGRIELAEHSPFLATNFQDASSFTFQTRPVIR